MKIGLALGGGGAKCFFHIGVFRVLESLKIKLDFLAGTSMGAVIGGLYALYQDSCQVESILLKTLDKYKKEILRLKSYSGSSEVEEKKIFLEESFNYVHQLYLWNLRMIKPFLVDPRPFVKILKELFGFKTFNACGIPFLCSAVDLKTGEGCFLNKGLLYKSILASCSLPGLFPPLKTRNQLLVDGGILFPLPTSFLREEVDFIIGVNLDEGWIPPTQIKNAVELMFIADRARYKKILDDTLEAADFLISLEDSSFRWTDFDKATQLIELGEKKALEKKENLIKILKRTSRKYFFLGPFLKGGKSWFPK